MVVPFHVTQMLKRVRARFFEQGSETRMLPKDDDFTTLRPVRTASETSINRY